MSGMKIYMVYHDIPWYLVVLHGITRYTVVYHMTLHGKLLFHVLCMVILWYTMFYLFQNTMVFYHGFPVSKHRGIYHGIQWYIFIRAV